MELISNINFLNIAISTWSWKMTKNYSNTISVLCCSSFSKHPKNCERCPGHCHPHSQWFIRLKKNQKLTGSKNGAIFGKITSRVTTKNLKIGQQALFEFGPFFSLFLMRKTLSSGQKWFLRPYFPLIRGMFLLRSGLRFSFRALEVPEPKVRKRPFFLLKWPFPHSQFEHFQCPTRKSKTTFQ